MLGIALPLLAVWKVTPLSRLVSIFTVVPAGAVCTQVIEDVVAMVAAGEGDVLTRFPFRKRRSAGATIEAPPFRVPLFALAVRSLALPALKFQYAASPPSLPANCALKLLAMSAAVRAVFHTRISSMLAWRNRVPPELLSTPTRTGSA